MLLQVATIYKTAIEKKDLQARDFSHECNEKHVSNNLLEFVAFYFLVFTIVNITTILMINVRSSSKG
jgi:hypothetical protein